jgi:hypothetical protein
MAGGLIRRGTARGKEYQKRRVLFDFDKGVLGSAAHIKNGTGPDHALLILDLQSRPAEVYHDWEISPSRPLSGRYGMRVISGRPLAREGPLGFEVEETARVG